MYTTIISTGELATHLTDDWAILDCRAQLQDASWGLARYRESHVPGAIHVDLDTDLAAPKTGRNGRHPLPSIEALAATFGRFGIFPTTQVVVYDQDSGLFASRAWWSLRYLGHDAVALLDGGFAKWTAEARPTRGGDESRTPTTFVARPRPEWHVPIDEVERLMTGPTLLVDARGAERFEGRSEPIDRVAGHIPGAVNHGYQLNLADDKTLLPREQLRAQFDQVLAGRSPADVVMYCGSGVSACHNLLAMAHAGLPGARLYAGSWSEWSSDPARPVETGPANRRGNGERGKGERGKGEEEG